jgi:signal transduction histidine kinase
LIEKVLPQEVATACLERIFKGAQRMAGIIESLLSFARPSDKGRKTDLDLVPVIREAVTLMSHQPDFARIDLQTTYPDAPVAMQYEALDIADPETPVGARGIGEAPVGSGFAAVVNAIADAVGHDVFRRAPVTADIILTSLDAGHRVHEPLTANI